MNKIKLWIVKIALKRALKSKGAKPIMAKLKKFLEGKKTYAVILAGVLTAVVDHYTNVNIPNDVWVIIFGALGFTVKSGFNRSENATKKLLEEIDKARNGKN